MALYFGIPPRSGQKLNSPQFTNRGLEIQRSTILQCRPTIQPSVEQVAYSIYRDNVSVWMKAGFENVPFRIDDPDNHIIPMSIRTAPDVKLPPIAFKVKKRLTMDEETKYVNELGLAVSGSGNQKLYFCTMPTFEKAKKIAAIPDVVPDVSSSLTSTSLNGIKTFGWALKIITAFLAVHSYSAKGNQSTSEALEGTYVVRANPTSQEPITKEDYAVMWPNKKRKGTNPMRSPQAEVMDVEMEEAEETRRKRIFPESLLGNQAIVKPRSVNPKQNYGPANAIPEEKGILVQYFPDCIEGDPALLPSILSHPCFQRLFGADRSAARQNYSEFKDGQATWSRTEEGKKIQHMFMGMQLALHGQARLYLILEEGEYHGFCLLGEEFHVQLGGVWHKPMEAAALREALGDMPTHTSAVNQIAHILTLCRFRDEGNDEDQDVDPRDLVSMRSIIEEMLPREISEGTFADLKTLVGQLSFRTSYWRVNKENVTRALSAIASKTPLDKEAPMYAAPSHMDEITIHSITFNVLSAFGPNAPSFLTTTGRKVNIPHPTEDDSASVINLETRKRPLETIVVYQRTLTDAMADMTEVFREKMIKPDQGERAAPHRGAVLKGKDRDELWKVLIDTVGVTRDIASEGGSIATRVQDSSPRKPGVTVSTDFD